MSSIKELLKNVKVEWKPLGEVAVINTGQKPSIIFEKHSDYYYINAGTSESGYCDNYNCDEDTVTTPSRGQGGIGYVGYQSTPFWLGPLCYKIKSFNNLLIINKFIYYYLKAENNLILSLKKEGGVPAINKADLAKIIIPIPPLKIQEEIVRILDTFTQTTAELSAELSARKNQYDYYREQLFTFDEGKVEWKTLGEVASKISSGGTPSTSKSEYWDNGTIPWMSSGEVNLETIYKTEKFITQLGLEKSSAKFVPKNSLVIALAGQGKTRGKVARTRIELTTNQSLASLVFDESIINPDYVYHFMNTQYEKLRQISSGSGTRGGLNLQMIASYPIPIPPLSEQERIVSILDKFDTLTTSISEGLPREIEQRQQQYEYYREMLLTFPREEQ